MYNIFGGAEQSNRLLSEKSRFLLFRISHKKFIMKKLYYFLLFCDRNKNQN